MYMEIVVSVCQCSSWGCEWGDGRFRTARARRMNVNRERMPVRGHKVIWGVVCTGGKAGLVNHVTQKHTMERCSRFKASLCICDSVAETQLEEWGSDVVWFINLWPILFMQANVVCQYVHVRVCVCVVGIITQKFAKCTSFSSCHTRLQERLHVPIHTPTQTCQTYFVCLCRCKAGSNIHVPCTRLPKRPHVVTSKMRNQHTRKHPMWSRRMYM